MSLQEIAELLQAAVEAGVYVAPTEPGLTLAELQEVGERLGLKQGEINDALSHPQAYIVAGPDRRLLTLAEHIWQLTGNLAFGQDPDLRDASAFDFVVAELNERAREVGSASARLDRNIVLERALAKSISTRHHLEVAMALMLLSGQLVEENGTLRFSHPQGGARPLPSATANQPGGPNHRFPKHARTRVIDHVKDVIERRSDQRAKSAEPFGAFAEKLEKLGHGHFRLWWTQTAAELGRADPGLSPLSALVLAAALVEGALTFVVKHARDLNLGVFGSTDFTRDPRTWKIDDLVTSAAKGGDAAILDPQSKNRVDGLIRTRQRIHAGRMLSEFPAGVPDLRPEEARDAKAVADLVVRRILDWLEKYPAS